MATLSTSTPGTRERRPSPRSSPSRPGPRQQHRDASTEPPTQASSINRVKARPAKDAVISSILSSFDSLKPPAPSTRRASQTTSLSSRRSGSEPITGTLAIRPTNATPPSTLHSTQAHGAEHVAIAAMADDIHLDDHDNNDDDDAAPPPSIRTSRPPSGLSHYSAHSPSRSPVPSNERLHPISTASCNGSLTSLLTTKESGNNKHSAESWIKSAAGKDTQEHVSARHSNRSLRRTSHQNSLRAPETVDTIAGKADAPVLSRAEQIIAATPPKFMESSKSRLYLEDSSISEEPSDTPSPAKESPISNGTPVLQSDNASPFAEQADPLEQSVSPPPVRLSPHKALIADSIPTRTSSLRQTERTAHVSKKRDKKAKRKTVAGASPEKTSEKAVEKSSEMTSPVSIPENSWADLGDDDETVKRIRQLQEQRKSRLIENSRLVSVPFDVPSHVVEPKVAASYAPPVAASRPSTSDRRPHARRISTDGSSKAHRILGIARDDIATSPPRNGVNGNTAHRPHQSMQHHTLDTRPLSPTSQTQSLSLDYSYTQAVDALQGADREMQMRKTFSNNGLLSQSNDRVTKSSESSRRINEQAIESPTTSPVQSRVRPKSIKSKVSHSHRVTAHHPDVPLEFDKRKSRRKSIGDNRRTRVYEDEDELPRRDSIEEGVLDYLRDPRLSRTVRHPHTRRLITFSEVGDPKGSVVFVCVGMGLTRFVTAFYDELATTLRLRLITVDRPGVGGSESYPPGDKTGPLSWPEDVLAICQELDITSFSLLAHSAGAIYALATALILPHMIIGRVHLLAPWIPPSQLEAISFPTTSAPPAGALPTSQRLLRILPTSFLKAANVSFMNATSTSLKPTNKRQLSASKIAQQRDQARSPTRLPVRPPTRDKPDFQRRESIMLMDQDMPTTNPMESFALPTKDDATTTTTNPLYDEPLNLSATATPMDPTFEYAATALDAAEHAERERKLEYTSRLTLRTWELATRDSNPARDLFVCLERHRDIGFRYTDVNRELIITHGAEDKRVPLGNVKWLAEQINSRALTSLAEDLISQRGAPPSREGWADRSTSRGGCEVRVLQGEGHGLMANAPIMGDVLTEIAGYWLGSVERGRSMFAME